MYISNPTLNRAEGKISDIDEDVKDSLNGVSTELMEEKERRAEGLVKGTGRVRGERYGKGRKNYQRHLTCSSSHYFPQFLSLENMQQHTKTATCSLQAPCNNSLWQTARATTPTSELSGQLEQRLDICASVKKNKNDILRH